MAVMGEELKRPATERSATKYPQKTVWLVDSSIYVFKAWYTRPDDLVDVNGKPINAVLGFIDFVYRLLSTEMPERIAFAFDESLATSHRKEIYPQYKANRSSAPESLRNQFRLCREFLCALGIHEAASSHYEADDLIGTWATALRSDDTSINIITADKDLAQLVHANDFWWEYTQNKKLDTKKITKRFRAKPRQIADQLALAGDKSDNIPGVPGIGMTTAGKLLKHFDTLENLLANISNVSSLQIRGAKNIQDAIEEHQETILLARQLTGICCNIERVDEQLFYYALFEKTEEDTFIRLCEQLNLSMQKQQEWLKLRFKLVS